jgi:hypothetical protein
MDVKEIIVEHLEANGFDGLVNCDAECGCSVDEAFIPCDGYFGECEPGYKIPDESGEYDYLITTKKPK